MQTGYDIGQQHLHRPVTSIISSDAHIHHLMPNHSLKHGKVHTGLFVQIFDHRMAETMESLGARLTMLSTHFHGTTIARKLVRQSGTELHSGMVHGVYPFL